jgi:alpha-galactosidase
MGWNSWNCWGEHIDQRKILDAAEALVSSGLADHGWVYVNIDDGWQGRRDPVTGALQPNERFPDMQGLCDRIHAMGLKVGIYSTPWVKSFAGYTGGSSGEPGGPVRDIEKGWYVGEKTYELADAKQWAKWGVDFLKYDWGPMDLDSGRRMRAALDACGRDIVFNATNSAPTEHHQQWADLCEAYFIWRRPAQGDNDIKDSWKSVSSIGFRMHEWRQFARPGHWNDPDMLVVGHVGWDKQQHPANLTPDEQRTHISLWCLLAAPLLLGCNLQKLDDVTVELLSNDEVLDIDQDERGAMGDRSRVDGDVEIWTKPLAGGDLAVGVFNRGDAPATYPLRWGEIGVATPPKRVRDVWRRSNVAASADGVACEIPSHGCVLLRLAV